MSESAPLTGKIIPSGVSDEILAERNRIFTACRDGDLSGEESYRSLLRLYWANTDANDETRQWVMDETFEVCFEANLDIEVTGDIWREEQERAN